MDRRDRQRRRHRYNVHRGTTAGFTPSDGEPDRAADRHELHRHRPRRRHLLLQASPPRTPPATSAPRPPKRTPVRRRRPLSVSSPPTGFDAGSGTTVADQSGNGNNGTIANASWAGAAAGRFGNALSFNGTNAFVSVAELVVARPYDGHDPRGLGATDKRWRLADGAHEGAPRRLRLRALLGHGRQPAGGVGLHGADREVRGTAQVAANTWTHLAATYDGSVLALYVNGAQAATFLTSGPITTNTGALKIGGNAVWGEWFSGLIDEVRVYNRALTAAEIQADMNTSISSPDTAPPSAPGTLTATGGLGQIVLGWGAATDNVVVAATTCTAARRPASRRAPATGSRSRRARATPTQASPRARTTTGSPPRTPPATSARLPQRGDGRLGGRHDAADRRHHAPRPPARPSPAPSRDRERVRQRRRSPACSSSSTARTSAPRTRPRRTRSRWDTFSAGNGPHTLSAVARDAAGNTAAAPNVAVTVPNTAAAGLVGALGVRRGKRHERLPTSRGAATTARSRTRTWIDERQVQQRRSRSTARTPGSPCPTPPRST